MPIKYMTLFYTKQKFYFFEKINKGNALPLKTNEPTFKIKYYSN